MEVIPVIAGTLVISLYLSDLSSGASCFGSFAPLCGQDGITYANECYAKQAHVEVKDNGPCPEKRCRCNRIMIDVCGHNGIQYNNPCLARCHYVERYTFGKCEDTE
ncbi:serine protease inhibitor dipetalogastin-like [Ostrea edulis]|uniref:serine protease inhibitor dipetalogastin-like n=1 Tax=Ostrea edulis TaxID=37623 RepID=UPI0024AFE960|nr:serine protease inhibitor dipetalogastin-like [Ostrea edulis]